MLERIGARRWCRSCRSDRPPFGGVFDEVVPHLTIAHGQDPELARAAERVIAPQLPIRARVDRVQLLAQHQPGSPWETLAELPLGRASGQVRRLR